MDNSTSRWSRPDTGLRTTFFLGLWLLSLRVTAQANPKGIAGTWLNQDKAAKIEIYQQGDAFFGKIVWLREPNENGKPKTDNKNPDPSRRNNPILGLVMLKDFKVDGQSTWEGGTLYDARSGKTYAGYLTLQADQSLKVRGYVGISLFGQTNIWTRTH